MAALQLALGEISYLLTYSSKRRSVALQIADGKLTVRAPVGVSVAEVNALIARKQSWITKHLSQTQVQHTSDWLKQGCVPLLDQLLPFQVQTASVSGVMLSDGSVIVSMSKRARPTDAKLRQLLTDWYKQQANTWFTERVTFWQREMNLTSAALTIGNWKTKWGYCKSNAELGFNWRLMMAPVWIADYVVVHELAHLRHLNHSEQFWQLVQHYYPRHTDAKLWLKQNQQRLEL